MEIARFIYQNNPDYLVEFDTETGNNLMINATQMAKIFNKRIDAFLKSDHAKQFISLLEISPIQGNNSVLKRTEIIKTKGCEGTWMHKILALKFAAWLNPEFELWVYSTIDRILDNSAREKKDVHNMKLQRKAEMALLRETLINNSQEASRYFYLENILKKADHKIIGIIRDQVNSLQPV
jgi:hypothetical protein